MTGADKKDMSEFGVGLRFTALSGIYTGLILTLHFTWMRHLSIPIPRALSLILGILSILIYLMAGIALHKHFRKGKLATSGIYAYSRHPIYGSWIVLIIPGLVLTLNSLVGLTAPLFMYAIFKALIGEEDKYLEEEFGDEFSRYKKRVGEILPRLRLPLPSGRP